MSWGMKTRLTVLALVLAAGSAFTAAGAAGKVVRAVDFDFKPKTVKVAEGRKVAWRGVEGTHTVTFNRSPFKRRKLDREISEGERFAKKTTRDGTFRYVCTLHPGMRGKVVVK
jgi:plastocyanin